MIGRRSPPPTRAMPPMPTQQVPKSVQKPVSNDQSRAKALAEQMRSKQQAAKNLPTETYGPAQPTPPKPTQPPPTASAPKPVTKPTTPSIEEILKGKTPSKGPTPMPVFGPVPKFTPEEKKRNEIELREKQKANPNPVVPSKKQQEMQKKQLQEMARATKKPSGMKSGGVAKYAKGGKIDGCARKGKTKGRMV